MHLHITDMYLALVMIFIFKLHIQDVCITLNITCIIDNYLYLSQEKKPQKAKLTDTAAVSLHLWLPFVPACCGQAQGSTALHHQINEHCCGCCSQHTPLVCPWCSLVQMFSGIPIFSTATQQCLKVKRRLPVCGWHPCLWQSIFTYSAACWFEKIKNKKRNVQDPTHSPLWPLGCWSALEPKIEIPDTFVVNISHSSPAVEQTLSSMSEAECGIFKKRDCAKQSSHMITT